jgi:curved DNA-binding protein CbpA
MATEQPDLYLVLQVDHDADQDAIRSAYRARAARVHPDAGGTAEAMAELNRAYAVLSDPVVRLAYDRRRRAKAVAAMAAMAAAESVATTADDGRAIRVSRNGSTLLDYGRYAGWSIAQVARHDPDFLEWFVRTPNGRRYHAEVEQALRDAGIRAAAATGERSGSRFGSRQP